jgi:adenylate cyclase
MAKLVIHDTEGTREIHLGKHNPIGRLPKDGISILDPLVSKEHCLIFLDPAGNYVLRDLGSRNGTLANGQRIWSDVILKKGDRITIGESSCIFVSLETEEPISNREDETLLMIRGQTGTWSEGDRFLPEGEIRNEKTLRLDYEKLRIAHDLQRDIGIELEIDRIFTRILDRTFELLTCDRAAILMADESGKMTIRAFKVGNRNDKLIISSTLVKCVQKEKVGIISADALSDERFKDTKSILLQRTRSSMAVPILYEKELLGIMIIDSASAVRAYSEKDLILFGNIARQTAQLIKISEMAEKISVEAVTLEKFQRLLSPDLAERVVSGELKVEKGGQSRFATVLFADMCGFTSMCENMEAMEVLSLLNEYFEVMAEVGFRYEGTVDKFVGDMIMLVWGAPVAHPDDPVRAVCAALDMQEALREYNEIRVVRGEPEIRMGIGINTGKLVAGYIGSNRTMSYSVVGDPVNIASRLCDIAGPGQILISEDTYVEISERFEVVELTTVHVKGKSKPIKVYDVIRAKK